MKANLITVICLSLGMFLFPSCKKEKKEDNTPPPLTAAGLSSGKAGIRLTTAESFKGSMSFDVSNTATTSAITEPRQTTKYIELKATEIKNSTPNRNVRISIVVPNTVNTANGTIQFDFPVQPSATRSASIYLESHSTFLGNVWSVTSGTLTITRLTATEIEGTFTGMATSSSTLGGPLTISNGLFAGKF